MSKPLDPNADPAKDEVNMPEFVQQKVSGQEAEIMLQFRSTYDLNVLYQRFQNGEKIDR